MKRAAAVAAAAITTLVTTGAFALDDSQQGPAYVQGSVGISYWDFPRLFSIGGFGQGYSWTGFNPTVEFGFHFSGRHDGFVLGIRQGFSVTALQGYAAGTTDARIGYDMAFKAGSLEINVDPFATVGVGYIFDGPHAGINAAGGIDVKLFLKGGFFVFGRPAEIGVQCFHDFGQCAFVYAAGAGAGFAFGG
jgi:hypothetical protein